MFAFLEIGALRTVQIHTPSLDSAGNVNGIEISVLFRHDVLGVAGYGRYHSEHEAGQEFCPGADKAQQLIPRKRANDRSRVSMCGPLSLAAASDSKERSRLGNPFS